MIDLIKIFFSILLGRIKVQFSLPPKKSLLIFDTTKIKDLEHILLKRDYYPLPVRVNQIKKIYVNLSIIKLVCINYFEYFNTVKKLNLWNLYLITLINLINPRLIITLIDNSHKYSEISKILKHKFEFLAIQNAARYDFIIENIEKKLLRNMNDFYLRNFLCYGEYEKDLYKKLNVDVKEYNVVGSLRKSNFFHYLKKKNIHLKKNLYKIAILLEEPLSVNFINNNDIKHFILPLKYSIRYSIENRITPIFIGKYSNLSLHLKKFSKYLSQKEIDLINKNFAARSESEFSSYMISFQSEVLIGVSSSLLREKLSSGEKILSCNYSQSFIWNFPVNGICSLNKKGYPFFQERLKKILNTSNKKYLEMLDKRYDYVLTNKYKGDSINKINNIIDENLKIA